MLANILLGVIYKVTSRFGTSISTDSQDVAQQVPEKMTGINALAHFSGNSDSIIFFTLIVVCLLLGVDLSRKLYKNNVQTGVILIMALMGNNLKGVSILTKLLNLPVPYRRHSDDSKVQ